MPHTHTMPNGDVTGSEIVDPANADLHWHLIDGVRTTSSPFGPNHTHELDAAESSKPNSSKKSASAGQDEREFKFMSGAVMECKEEERDGVRIGIVKGHIATWDEDRGGDRFQRGAFTESIRSHQEKNRPLRLKDHHWKTIGGFPADTLREDEKGLYGVGEINLEVQEGREAYALAKQGILSDFSVGFSALEWRMEGSIRVLEKARLWEGSIVDEPMNPEATITEVKTVEPTTRNVEKALRAYGFTKSESKRIASQSGKKPDDSASLKSVLDEVKQLTEQLKSS